MATPFDDLVDELNRPPRRMRLLRALPVPLPMAAGAETLEHYIDLRDKSEDQEMGEPTLGEILVAEMSEIKKLLNDSLKAQAQTNLDLVRRDDAMQRDIDDLKVWRQRVEQAPEKQVQQQVQRSAIIWQKVNGWGGLISLGIVLLAFIAPYIHISIGK